MAGRPYRGPDPRGLEGGVVIPRAIVHALCGVLPDRALRHRIWRVEGPPLVTWRPARGRFEVDSAEFIRRLMVVH